MKKTTTKTTAKTTAKPTKKMVAAKKVKKMTTEEISPVVNVAMGEEKASPRYFYAIGRRKTSTGVVRLYTRGQGEILVNKQNYEQYFPTAELRNILEASLNEVGQRNNVNVQITVFGGGKKGQAGAASLGLARALLKLNPVFRRALRRHGFLTRDSREKERKKPGLKKARRAPQFSKR